MGRAGGGGGSRAGGGHSGGGMRSGGGHSSSGFRSTGSSSGRAGGGSFSSGRAGGGYSGGSQNNSGRAGGPQGMGTPGGMGRRGGMNPPPPGGRRRMFFGFRPFGRRGYGGGYYRGAGGGCLTSIIILIILVFLLVYAGIARIGSNQGNETVQTTITDSLSEDSGDSVSDAENGGDEADISDEASGSARVKAESDLEFDSSCILDELGWFENAETAGENLEDFFNETGVQPYIYLRSYDSSLTTDSAKDDYAQQWYEDNIDNEQTFLYIYFAEEDTDNDVGYMSCVCGYDIEDVMDEEARELFWDYIDEYWPTDLSTDEMFATIFNSLADKIM